MNQHEATIETLRRRLSSAQNRLPGMRVRLIDSLSDAAIAGHAEEPDSISELRRDIAAAERVIAEAPAIIEELELRLKSLRARSAADSTAATRTEADRLFFELLEQIVTTGAATPTEITELRRRAGSSSNAARRFDIDRLEDALEDHARQTRAAAQWERPLPVFRFALEEQEVKP